MSKNGIEVIILAGGLGTRLRRELDGLPKSMAIINELPFLKYLLDYLASFEVEHVIMSVGYRRGCIHKWLDEHYQEYPFDIDFAVENDPLGTGGGLLLAMTYLRRDKAIVMNGDTFFNIDIHDFYENAEGMGSSIAIALKPMNNFSRYTNVILDSSENSNVDSLENSNLGASESSSADSVSNYYSGVKIKSFEKGNFCKQGYIKGGIYYIDRSKVDINKYPEIFSLEEDMLTSYASEGEVYGILYDNYFIDIGVPKDYHRARRELPEVFSYMHLATLDFSNYNTLILSRDGVINRVRRKKIIKSKREFEFIPGFLDMIQIVSPLFENIIIVTNQSDVAKEHMSSQDLEDVHRYMVSRIESMKGKINAIYVCSASSDDNPYRKPNIGMFEQACIDFPNILSETTIMIGSSKTDKAFAANSGIDYFGVNFRSYK